MFKLSFASLVTIVIALMLWLFFYAMHLTEEHVQVIGLKGKTYYVMDDPEKDGGPIHFDLVDPETAPANIRSKVLYGYHLMLETKTHAPEFVGNTLDCNNCHFCAGNTLGGKNRGISLVGVTATYPKFSKRDNKNITLEDRLNNCFKRSMNGKEIDPKGIEMESLVAYLSWISHDVAPHVKSLPWLGTKPLPTTHTADPEKGEKVYDHQCSLCHGENGEGTTGVPPLWGDFSFNDGAGMNTLPMLSSFIWQNMPYGQASLSPEDALDVASFIIKQPRPHFQK